MHQVYAKADQVLFWPGPCFENSDLAMALIHEAECHDFASSWVEKMVQDEDILSKKVFKVARLFLRGYWSRVWVIQELAYARDVLVMCGSSTAKYTSLIAFASALRDMSSSFGHFDSRAFYRSLMANFLYRDARRIKQKGPGKRLDASELMDILSQRLCKDRRDMIYGVHSLLNPELQQHIPIDYSKTTAEVYTSTARAAIENQPLCRSHYMDCN
jgi:hypothetical protein